MWETTSTYEGHSVRLIVVESSALDQRKGKTLEKERNQEAELLRQKQTQWESRLFSCREDAEQALASLKASLRLRFHRVEASVEAIVRPKNGADVRKRGGTGHGNAVRPSLERGIRPRCVGTGETESVPVCPCHDRSGGMERSTDGCERDLEVV